MRELEGLHRQVAEQTGEPGDRMKQRVYALSKEVAALTKERDEMKQRLEKGGIAAEDKELASGFGPPVASSKELSL